MHESGLVIDISLSYAKAGTTHVSALSMFTLKRLGMVFVKLVIDDGSIRI